MSLVLALLIQHREKAQDGMCSPAIFLLRPDLILEAPVHTLQEVSRG